MRVRVCLSVLALLLAACGGGGQGASPGDVASSSVSEDASEALSGQLTVFAAASLTDAFEAIGERFTAAHPEVELAFNFASSSTLATQITQGAPADVFAAADQTQMDAVDYAGRLAGGRSDLTGNHLVIAVEAGNPLGIEGLADLSRSDVTLVLAAEEVPAGRYAREALDAQGIQVAPSSLEVDVRAVLARVVLGEADAGIVYASDVATAGDEVEGVGIPVEHNVVVSYPIATLADAPNPPVAQAFVDHVRSDEAQALLDEHGFTAREPGPR